MIISKEVRVGIVSILAIGILVWGYNYLKGTNLFYSSTSVYAVYPKVPGLSVSAPIIINGVQSGIVEAIYFHPNKSSSVIVKLSLSETALVIPRNSVAELISVDFMGSKAIGLKLGDASVELQPGDTLQVDFEPSMLENFSEQILPIKDELQTMMDTLKVATTSFTLLMDNFNDVLAARFDLGWNDVSGPEKIIIDANGDTHTIHSNMSVWEFTAGIRAKFSFVYIEARAGYFSGVNKFGYVPAVGLKFGKFDIQGNYTFIEVGETEWAAVRLAYYWGK